MYENGIDVVYETRSGSADPWSEHVKVTLPGWCAGDVPMGVALYVFGNRDYVDDVRITDWQPRVDELDGTEAAGVTL